MKKDGKKIFGIKCDKMSKMTEKELWKWIRKAQWKKDHDYKRIEKFYIFNLNPSQLMQLRSFVDKKIDALDKKYRKYWIDNIPISDDSWMDLRAEVIGRGESFYKSITPAKLKKIGETGDYRECFEYGIPHAEDIKSIFPDYWKVK